MKRRLATRFGAPIVLGTVFVACLVAAVESTPVAEAGTTASGSGSWTVYHGDTLGSGAVPDTTAIDVASPAWTSPTLDGELYGEPLAFDGDVFVATESDTVDALSASTGAIVWSTHVGTPVPASDLPCGDISPTVGITGTPVIDAARSEIFVVADELIQDAPAHMLIGLDTATGKTELDQDVDPGDSTPSALLQRTGLALDEGRVVFGFGGNYGDCSTYRGRVVAVNEGGGTPQDFTVDGAAGESGGAVWMGGAAPVVDASGDIWVSTGNGSVTSTAHAYDDSEAVLELSPSLTLLQYFAPAAWTTFNADDLDLSTAPALLPDGQVVVSGKPRVVYLLKTAGLGGIGGQEASIPSGCGDDVDGGPAEVGTTVYLPCLSGIMAVRATASPPSLTVLWRSGTGGGPPIVAGGLVWTLGQDGTLSGLDPTTGAVREQVHVETPANHFPTPSVGDGLLLVPTADQVVAFRASSGTPTTTQPRSTTTSTAQTTTSAPTTGGGGTPIGLIVGAVLGGLVVIALGVWLARRPRR